LHASIGSMLGRIRAAMPVELKYPKWSDAEFLDVPIPDRLTVRAVVCRLAYGQWQWSISAIDGDRGALISIGTEDDASAARLTAMSEIGKCVGDR